MALHHEKLVPVSRSFADSWLRLQSVISAAAATVTGRPEFRIPVTYAHELPGADAEFERATAGITARPVAAEFQKDLDKICIRVRWSKEGDAR